MRSVALKLMIVDGQALAIRRSACGSRQTVGLGVVKCSLLNSKRLSVCATSVSAKVFYNGIKCERWESKSCKFEVF
jgi:hypothetical protein